MFLLSYDRKVKFGGVTVPNDAVTTDALSPWWRHTVILTMVVGFTILIWMSAKTYQDAPPIPQRVVETSGKTLFTREDILAGQAVFLRYGLMDNGTIWGHGAYLGPDFSAAYLHMLAVDAGEMIAKQKYGHSVAELSPAEQSAVSAEAQQLLKQNRYDPRSQSLRFTEPEILSYRRQIEKWTAYFSEPGNNGGLPAKYIRDGREITQLTAFFAWTAWASVANRPGKSYSYTNNFPYDPMVGNTPSSDALLWSALSLVALLAGIAAVLFAFGKFDYLGWKGKNEHIHPQMLPGTSSESQKAVIKYFLVVALLFFAQVVVGGATAHYRAEPAGFYGIDLSAWFPSHLVRTWHLQLAIFWIATAYIAGGLFLAPSLGGKDPAGQVRGVNLLFVALVIVVAGSLLGEMLGLNQLLGGLWFWFGHQGWEYLELGRGWQILLAVGLILWLVLLFRGVAPSRKDPERREITSLFLYAALAIPLFYLPAMFFDSSSHFSVVDMWRFWIIHMPQCAG